MWTQTCTQGEYNVNLKTEVGVMLLEAKDHQRLSAKHQKLGESQEKDSFL